MNRIVLKLSDQELIYFQKLLKFEVNFLNDQLSRENSKVLNIPDHDIIFELQSKISCFQKMFSNIKKV